MSGEVAVSFYDLTTGEFTQAMRIMSDSPDRLDHDIALNCAPGWGAVLGNYSSDGFFVADGHVSAKPVKPGPWAVWDAGAWTDPRTTAVLAAELTAARLSAVAAINSVAGRVRRLYVTDIPGQEALYLMKEAEARAWVASADPNPTQFPLIAAEIGITGTDGGQVAQVYLNLAGIYTVAAAQLETLRLGHIAQAEVAESAASARAIADAFAALITA